MLVYPQINPVAITIGSFKLYWYGIMYLLSFVFFLQAAKWRIKRFGHPILTAKIVDDFLFYGALGVIIGGRLGYCLFYQPGYYLSHPLSIVRTWDGGMSFHGGMLGVFVAIYWFCRQLECSFFVLADFIAPFIPVCLMLGRIGNFINGELWGRFCSPTLPWGMIFPHSGSMLPRHPSQLYEAAIEGLLLLVVMLVFIRKPRVLGQTSGVFMLGYGLARFSLEFFRQPDVFANSVVQSIGFSLGQLYSLPMIIAGIAIYCWACKSQSLIKH